MKVSSEIPGCSNSEEESKGSPVRKTEKLLNSDGQRTESKITGNSGKSNTDENREKYLYFSFSSPESSESEINFEVRKKDCSESCNNSLDEVKNTYVEMKRKKNSDEKPQNVPCQGVGLENHLTKIMPQNNTEQNSSFELSKSISELENNEKCSPNEEKTRQSRCSAADSNVSSIINGLSEELKKEEELKEDSVASIKKEVKNLNETSVSPENVANDSSKQQRYFFRSADLNESKVDLKNANSPNSSLLDCSPKKNNTQQQRRNSNKILIHPQNVDTDSCQIEFNEKQTMVNKKPTRKRSLNSGCLNETEIESENSISANNLKEFLKENQVAVPVQQKCQRRSLRSANINDLVKNFEEKISEFSKQKELRHSFTSFVNDEVEFSEDQTSVCQSQQKLRKSTTGNVNETKTHLDEMLKCEKEVTVTNDQCATEKEQSSTEIFGVKKTLRSSKRLTQSNVSLPTPEITKRSLKSQSCLPIQNKESSKPALDEIAAAANLVPVVTLSLHSCNDEAKVKIPEVKPLNKRKLLKTNLSQNKFSSKIKRMRTETSQFGNFPYISFVQDDIHTTRSKIRQNKARNIELNRTSKKKPLKKAKSQSSLVSAGPLNKNKNINKKPLSAEVTVSHVNSKINDVLPQNEQQIDSCASTSKESLKLRSTSKKKKRSFKRRVFRGTETGFEIKSSVSAEEPKIVLPSLNKSLTGRSRQTDLQIVKTNLCSDIVSKAKRNFRKRPKAVSKKNLSKRLRLSKQAIKKKNSIPPETKDNLQDVVVSIANDDNSLEKSTFQIANLSESINDKPKIEDSIQATNPSIYSNKETLTCIDPNIDSTTLRRRSGRIKIPAKFDDYCYATIKQQNKSVPVGTDIESSRNKKSGSKIDLSKKTKHSPNVSSTHALNKEQNVGEQSQIEINMESQAACNNLEDNDNNDVILNAQNISNTDHSGYQENNLKLKEKENLASENEKCSLSMDCVGVMATKNDCESPLLKSQTDENENDKISTYEHEINCSPKKRICLDRNYSKNMELQSVEPQIDKHENDDIVSPICEKVQSNIHSEAVEVSLSFSPNLETNTSQEKFETCSEGLEDSELLIKPIISLTTDSSKLCDSVNEVQYQDNELNLSVNSRLLTNSDMTGSSYVKLERIDDIIEAYKCNKCVIPKEFVSKNTSDLELNASETFNSSQTISEFSSKYNCNFNTKLVLEKLPEQRESISEKAISDTETSNSNSHTYICTNELLDVTKTQNDVITNTLDFKSYKVLSENFKSKSECRTKFSSENNLNNEVSIPLSDNACITPEKGDSEPQAELSKTLDSSLELTKAESESDFNDIKSQSDRSEENETSDLSTFNQKPRHTFKFSNNSPVQRPPSRPHKFALQRPEFPATPPESPKPKPKILKVDVLPKISKDIDAISIYADTITNEPPVDTPLETLSDSEDVSIWNELNCNQSEANKQTVIDEWFKKSQNNALYDKTDKPSTELANPLFIPLPTPAVEKSKSTIEQTSTSLEIQGSSNFGEVRKVTVKSLEEVTKLNSEEFIHDLRIELPTTSEHLKKLPEEVDKVSEDMFYKMCISWKIHGYCPKSAVCTKQHKLPMNWKNNLKLMTTDMMIGTYERIKNLKFIHLLKNVFAAIIEILGAKGDFNNITALLKDILKVDVNSDRTPFIESIISALTNIGLTYYSTVDFVFQNASCLRNDLKNLLCDILLQITIEKGHLSEHWSVIQMLSQKRNFDIDLGVTQTILMESFKEEIDQKELCHKMYNDFISKLPDEKLLALMSDMLNDFIKVLRKLNLNSEASTLYERCANLGIPTINTAIKLPASSTSIISSSQCVESHTREHSKCISLKTVTPLKPIIPSDITPNSEHKTPFKYPPPLLSSDMLKRIKNKRFKRNMKSLSNTSLTPSVSFVKQQYNKPKSNFQSTSFQSPNFKSPNVMSSNFQSINFKPRNFKSSNFQSANFKSTTNNQSNNFQSNNYQSTNFQSTNFKLPDFKFSNFQPPSLHSSNFQSANLQSPNFQSSNFQSFNPQSSNFHSTNPQSSNFPSTNSQSFNFHSTNPQSSNFLSTNPQSSSFYSTEPQSFNFPSTNSQSSNFSSTNSQSFNFHSTNSQSSNFHSTNPQSSNFQSTNPQSSNFYSTNPQSSNFQSTNSQSYSFQPVEFQPFSYRSTNVLPRPNFHKTSNFNLSRTSNQSQPLLKLPSTPRLNVNEIKKAVFEEDTTRLSELIMGVKDNEFADPFLEECVTSLLKSSHNFPTFFNNLCRSTTALQSEKKMVDLHMDYILKTLGVNIILYLITKNNWDAAYLVFTTLLNSISHTNISDVVNIKLYVDGTFSLFKRVIVMIEINIRKEKYSTALDIFSENAVWTERKPHLSCDPSDIPYRNIILDKLLFHANNTKQWQLSLKILSSIYFNEVAGVLKRHTDTILNNAISHNCSMTWIHSFLNSHGRWYQHLTKNTFRSILVKMIEEDKRNVLKLYELGSRLNIYPKIIGNETYFEISTHYIFEEIRVMLEILFQKMVNFMPINYDLQIRIIQRKEPIAELPNFPFQKNATFDSVRVRIANILQNYLKPSIMSTFVKGALVIKPLQLQTHLEGRMKML